MYRELMKFKYIEAVKDLQVVNLGTGMGYYDFEYSQFNIKAFNFALPQQNLQFDYMMLKQYSSCMQKGCKVIIVLPYFIFCAHFFDELRTIYERYYLILPKDEVEPFCESTYDGFRRRFKLNDLQNGLELCKPLNEMEMEEQSVNAVINWESKLKLTSCMSGELSCHAKNQIIETKKWLHDILRFCSKSEFEPYIVVPPMSRVLLSKIGTEFVQTHFYEPLYDVIGENVVVLDYSTKERFTESCLYGWPGFLIKSAAKNFTADVLSALGVL